MGKLGNSKNWKDAIRKVSTIQAKKFPLRPARDNAPFHVTLPPYEEPCYGRLWPGVCKVVFKRLENRQAKRGLRKIPSWLKGPLRWLWRQAIGSLLALLYPIATDCSISTDTRGCRGPPRQPCRRPHRSLQPCLTGPGVLLIDLDREWQRHGIIR